MILKITTKNIDIYKLRTQTIILFLNTPIVSEIRSIIIEKEMI